MDRLNLLNGKISLITGCSRGIGEALLRLFVENGSIVYANDRDEGNLESLCDELNDKYGNKVIPVYFDVNDKSKIKETIIKIKKEQEKLDILVNNAGIMKDALIDMIDDDTMINTFNTNVFSLVHMTQMALKIMRKQKSGSIINLSSIVGLRGNYGQTVYSASKGAVATLTKTWARELVKEGIRVNAIAPGKINTTMFHSIGEEKVAEQIKEVGFGRLGEPEEVAKVALFLASDLSSYVTGEIIGVNGGWFL